jgi:hypothetical protein
LVLQRGLAGAAQVHLDLLPDQVRFVQHGVLPLEENTSATGRLIDANRL